MKQVFVMLLLLCAGTGEVLAQKYSTAAGVRLSRDVYGLNLKQKVYKGFYLEGIAAGSDREVTGTLLLEKHFPLVGKGLSGYIGGGGHVGNLKDFGPTYGADALIGVEMKLPFLPLAVAADFKPAYQIEHEDWFDFNTSVSVRYVLGKENKKQREKAREKKRKKKDRLKARAEKQKTKEKKQKQKEKDQRKEEKARAKAKAKGQPIEEDRKLLGNVHLLQVFKKKEAAPPQPTAKKNKRKEAKGETIEADTAGKVRLLQLFKKKEAADSEASGKQKKH